MKLRTLLLSGVVGLISASAAVLAQSPGINNNFPITWTLVWEAATTKPTYSASQVGITAVSSQTDMCSMSGSATKTVRVRKAIFSNLPTAAVVEPIAIVKRSTLSTGAGTAIAAVPYDSQSAAATATLIEVWTAAPTLGTLVGVIADIAFPFQLTTGATSAAVFEFGRGGDSAVVLRGILESLAINLSAVTATGTVGCTFVWTEE